MLKNHYGNQQCLINTYIEQFVQLDKIEKSNDVILPWIFYNRVGITIRNLKSLTIELSAYGSSLIPVLTTILDKTFGTKIENLFLSEKNLLVQINVFRKVICFWQQNVPIFNIIIKNKEKNLGFERLSHFLNLLNFQLLSQQDLSRIVGNY